MPQLPLGSGARCGCCAACVWSIGWLWFDSLFAPRFHKLHVLLMGDARRHQPSNRLSRVHTPPPTLPRCAAPHWLPQAGLAARQGRQRCSGAERVLLPSLRGPTPSRDAPGTMHSAASPGIRHAPGSGTAPAPAPAPWRAGGAASCERPRSALALGCCMGCRGAQGHSGSPHACSKLACDSSAASKAESALGPSNAPRQRAALQQPMPFLLAVKASRAPRSSGHS